MHLSWNAEKNIEIEARYGFGFERAIEAINDGRLLAIRDHPNKVRYGHQKQLVVNIDGYVWVVPCIVQGDAGFLKTMFPSRRATRDHIGA
jgi:hypothetical protein